MKYEVQVLVLQVVVSLGLIFSPLEKYELIAIIIGLGLCTMAFLIIKYFADIKLIRKRTENKLLEIERDYIFNLILGDNLN